MTIEQAITDFEPADEYFGAPFVDVDEWRDQPTRHRYVHGGFADSETRFSIYLPTADAYQGRFFQHVTPVPDSENLAPLETGPYNKIGMANAAGAYFLETNGGGAAAGPGYGADPTIGAYRANAAAARFSRVVAGQMYGPHRTFGYLYGGSGGGFRTMGAAENTSGVWDGFVPYVIGSPVAAPNVFTVRMHAQRILRDKFEGIVDAVEPGGSGDMFTGLDDDEREALLEVTRMGFPPHSWFDHKTMGMHGFSAVFPGMRMIDPTYFDDFWALPGYLGHSAPPSLLRDTIEWSTTVASVLTSRDLAALVADAQPTAGSSRGGVDDAWLGSESEVALPVAVRLSHAVDRDVMGADLVVVKDSVEVARVGLISVEGDVALFGPADPASLALIAVGDQVVVDNRAFLAAQTYHRHQVPGPDYPVWDQFRLPDGSPKYPQRPMQIGPLFAAGAAGTVQTGEFEGKMIVVAALLDREAFPWQADWYRGKVAEHLGDAMDDCFRLWYVENAVHGDGDGEQANLTHTVSYVGVLHRALRDLAAWVEHDRPPVPTTKYLIDDGQVVVPTTASERGGLQAVIDFSVEGAARADVTVGQQVHLRATAEAPAGAGSVVGFEWDTLGTGAFEAIDVVPPAATATSERIVSFVVPGTYFPVVRVTANRDGDVDDIYARLVNLARVRVVVSESTER